MKRILVVVDMQNDFTTDSWAMQSVQQSFRRSRK